MTCKFVFPGAHIDEIDDDQPPQIAQAKLAGDDPAGLQIGLQNHLILVVLAHVFAAVDVNGRHRLGLVDHDRAAAAQPDFAPQGLLKLLFHFEGVEDIDRRIVVMNPLAELGDHLLAGLDQLAHGRLGIDQNLIHVVGKVIARDAGQDFLFVINADRRMGARRSCAGSPASVCCSKAASWRIAASASSSPAVRMMNGAALGLHRRSGFGAGAGVRWRPRCAARLLRLAPKKASAPGNGRATKRRS